MKKKITLLIGAMWMVSSLSAQLKLADFEDEVSCFTHASAGLTPSIAANPSSDAVNSSSKVLKLDYEGAGKAIARDWSKTPSDGLASFTVGEANGQYRYVHFKVRKQFTSQIQCQFRKESGGGTGYVTSSNTTVDQWEYIVLDLMNEGTGSYSSGNSYPGFHIFLAYNYTAQTTYTAYIDDIYLSDSDTPIGGQMTDTDKTVKNTGISVAKKSGKSTILVNGITGYLKLEIFNLQGQLIKEVYNGAAASDSYEIPALTGVHILKATTSNGVLSIKF
jgi:hypothetical protein